MDAKSLIVGAIIFGLGFGAGMLFNRAVTPERGPLGLTAEHRAEAQDRAERIKAGVHLRQIAQAVVSMRSDDPEWTLPATETDLIDQLIEADIISRDIIDDWPGGMNRPAGEPPFFLVGTIEQVAARDGSALLLVEHPAHHGEAGGSIVFADTSTELVDPQSLHRAIAGEG